MKTVLSITTIVAALGSGHAVATAAGPPSPYGVRPHEVRLLNKEPSAADIANICDNKAKYRGLSGEALDKFLTECKSEV